jgi:hypothetical protein
MNQLIAGEVVRGSLTCASTVVWKLTGALRVLDEASGPKRGHPTNGAAATSQAFGLPGGVAPP